MSSSAKLEQLVQQWKKLRDEGAPVSAADLCQDDPELAADLRRLLDSEEEEPAQEYIGRYRLLQVLGAGGFGVVYLAQDDELNRQVAIKLPYRERMASAGDVEAFLREAQIVARLDHPNIVPVYDVGRDQEGRGFVVSKYLDGKDLVARLKVCRPTIQEAAHWTILVAEAIHHAHEHKVVHRDIKPSNILLDGQGAPHVVDFGLALKEEDLGQNRKVAGTPTYMSPEQALREGHRVDCRSDIFSLGVVFYELLTGALPFVGDSLSELLENIASAEPVPPRQLDDSIPQELERICLKAMAKRSSDRYETGRELAEDLRLFIDGREHENADGAGRAIIPKGLRSFDADDASFFLELLPGPRDRNGLPESIRFWKTRIEEVDADATFSVGLIYGPSGSGKSSLLKAGLLPRLAGHVLPVFVEATGQETESRLLRGLKKRCPALEAAHDLVEALACLRKGLVSPGKKCLLIIDQFEQWLHTPHDHRQAELIRALRQCDGQHVQCLLLARDDFAMAATRFMDALDVPILQGSNFATIDNFDPLHARKILACFGRAFGRLTVPPGAEENRFLDQAIAGLAPEERVVPVRLALFAEMIKGKPWTLKTLKEIGGTAGVGLAFLEETFSAHPKLRHHEKAARAVLKALLPAQGSEIKGSMLSKQELLARSGYAEQPADFEELTRTLDAELRLIAPTDPQAIDEAAARQGEYFQLTHDYLVPSLRDWLTRKQRETRRGRAELMLAERATLWNSKPEARFLPSWPEWLRICFLTSRHNWLPTQRRMMQQATRFHLLRGGLLASLLLTALCATFYARARIDDDRKAAKAASLVQSIKNARTDQLPALLEQTGPYRKWADPLLRQAAASAPPSSRQQLHLRLALLPVEPEQADHLLPFVLAGEPGELLAVSRLMQPRTPRLRQQFVKGLWRAFDAAPTTPLQRFHIACVLAGHDATNPRWPNVVVTILDQLLESAQRNPAHYADLLELLRPLNTHLQPLFEQALHDDRRYDAARLLAASFLADYANDQPAFLIRLLLDADHDQFLVYYEKVALHKEHARTTLRKVVAEPLDAQPTVDAKETLARRQANAAIALLRLGESLDFKQLLQSRDDPRIRSYLIDRLGPFGVESRIIVAELDKQAGTSIRRALILSLGGYDRTDVPVQQLMPRLLDWYASDPDPGIHGSIRWLLSSWSRQADLDKVDQQLATGRFEGKRRWFVSKQRQTLVALRGPHEYMMGSPPGEFGREGGPQGLVEKQARVRIPYSFALADREVTVRDFAEFRKSTSARDFATTPNSPVNLVSWYDAVAYCNWLSAQEGIPRDQWCYAPDEQGQYSAGTKIKPDFLERAGYRLPTEAEWELACRAGSLTSRPHGDGDELLEEYAWYTANSHGRRLAPVGTLKPNDLGLFDMLGNVSEWCQDRFLSDNTPVGDTRSMRGGSFVDAILNVRSAVRDRYVPDFRDHYTGFRVARTITPDSR